MRKSLIAFVILICLFSLSLYSQDAAAIYREGQQELRNGNFPAAIDRFRDVLLIDPNFYFAYLNLGIAYRRQGNLEDAITTLEEAGLITHRDERFFGQFAHHLELAGIYMQQRDTDNAIKQYKEAIEILKHSQDERTMPRYIRALSSLAEIYYYSKRDYQATYDLLKGPYDSGIRETDLDLLLGKTTARLNRTSEAFKYYRDSNIMNIESLEEKDYISLVEFWRLATLEQDTDLTVRIAKKLVDTPKPAQYNAPALVFLGRSHMIAENYRPAADAFKRAIAAGYDDPAEAYRLKGISYFNIEDFANAERTLKASVQRDQTNPEAYYFLGLSLARQEKRPEAKEQYEKALSINPEYTAAKEALDIVNQQIEQDRLKAEEEEEFRRLEEEGKL